MIPPPELPRRVRKLVDADATNAEVSPSLMADLHPFAVAAFDEAAGLFRFLAAELDERHVALHQRLADLAPAHGISNAELAARIAADDLADMPFASEIVQKARQMEVVKVLVAACERYSAWGAAELFRLRIGPAQGYLRLEAEAMGWSVLSLQDASLSAEWTVFRSGKEAAQFFRKSQPRIKETLKKYDLTGLYDIASGVAQHVRLAGLVRSLDIGDGTVRLPDQDFAKDDPFSFHLAVGHFHRIQVRVLGGLGIELIPDEGRFREALKQLHERVDDVWRRLHERHGREIAKFSS